MENPLNRLASRLGGRYYRAAALAAVGVGVVVGMLSCATTPPSNIDDLCLIFDEKDDWYDDALSSEERWGTPIHVQMAIVRQESAFRDDAQPPRRKLLGVIPWTRPSSAFGYPQAKDSTWAWYVEKTGNRGADRDDFADAMDFVGWYTDMSHRLLGISKWDAYRQYLADHEGHGGYKRRTYQQKAWLESVARRVDGQAKRYARQLQTCRADLEQGWSIWPF